MNRQNTQDYADYKREHLQELLADAVAHIDPDAMGMDRDQALTLAGAMKACGFSQVDYAAVMARSTYDKGTFAKQWDKFRGSGKNGDCTDGTIFDYAQRCGWKWPAPDRNGEQIPQEKKKPAQDLPELVKKWDNNFKLSVIIDSKEYTQKPAQTDAQEIRGREQLQAPAPEPITPQEFASAVVHGRTFYPTIYTKAQTGTNENGRPRYDYIPQAQQVFIVDIDNEQPALDEDGKPIKGKKQRIEKPLTKEDALRICDSNGIKPLFYYETFSSKAHREDPEEPYTKFRLVFATDKPITARKHGEHGLQLAIKYFVGLFGPAADTSTTDPARLIYGTDEADRAALYPYIIDSKKLLQRVYGPAPEPQKDPVNGQKILTPAEEIDAFIDAIQTEKYTPIPTGISDLDEKLGGGLMRQQVGFLNAAPGMGKTALCQTIAEKMAQNGHRVIYYNLEMSKEQMIARSLSRIGAADLDALQILQAYKLPQEKIDAIREAAEIYKNRTGDRLEYNPQYYDTDTQKYRDCNAELDNILLSMEQAAKKAKKEEQPAPICFIDYLHLLRGTGKEDAAETIKRAVEALKDYAIQHNTLVMIISANNRSANKAGKGVIDTGRDTSAIEYSGDIMLSLNYELSDRADGMTAEEVTEKIQECREKGQEVPPEYRRVSLRITKNRFGETNGRTILDFDGKHSKFTQIERIAGNKYRPLRTADPTPTDPGRTVLKARGNRERRRADYIAAYTAIKEDAGEVTTEALADYLGVSQATVKSNIKDLCAGMFKLDGIKQGVQNLQVTLATDPEFMDATDADGVPFEDSTE